MDKPDATSRDYDAMSDHWRMVTSILGGAKTMRTAGETYLPKFPAEKQADYDYRRKTAPFTNLFRDIVENLAQRPFGSELALAESAPTAFETLAEDIDARGNNLHVFAGDAFFNGIAKGLDWILVDHTAAEPARTRAEEIASGARPYWVRIPAENMLEARSDMVAGKETFVLVRIIDDEDDTRCVRVMEREPVAFDERNRPTAYGPPMWSLWAQRKEEGTQAEWAQVIDPRPLAIPEIPLVPVLMGRRIGSTWRYHPPMQDAADLQVELFQQESALKNIKELTAFPMLAANGVDGAGPDGKPIDIPVGPRAVLFAPPGPDGNHGEWAFIEPTAQSLIFLADHIKQTKQELRELGRQPLTSQSGNLTVVTTAFAAQKGNAAIQAWALALKDALEQAFYFTGLYIGEPAGAEVIIDTDFDLGFGDDESFNQILAMKAGSIISRAATVAEAKRRGILMPEYDADADQEAILIDQTGSDAGDGMDP